MLKGVEDEAFLQIAINIAHYHHEKWEGSGYPDGLKGTQIHSSVHKSMCFNREIAMSPKYFIKIIRFQSALDMLHSDERKSLSEIASALGYFDQPHFVKEFKEFSGVTPKKYEQFLDSRQYSSKIEIFG